MSVWKWYQRYPELFRKEREALESRGFSLNDKTLEQEGKVEFNGKVNVEGKDYSLIIVYPSGFPDFVPECYSTDFKDARHHDEVNGKLCLYEEWKYYYHGVNGEAVIERAMEWISKQKTGFSPEEEIDGPEPKQYHRLSILHNSLVQSAIFIPDEVYSEWENGEGNFKIKLHKVSQHFYKGLVTELHSHPTTWKASGVYEQLAANFPEFNGKCFSVDEAPPYFQTQQEIISWLASKGHREVVEKCKSVAKHLDHPQNFVGPLLGIRYLDEVGQRGSIKPRLLIIALKHIAQRKSNLPVRHFPFMIFESKEFSQDKLFKRVSALRPLKDKHVVVVGLGTIGSQVALELAKAGVGKMTLVDPDIVDTGNVVRHICDLHHVGIPKVYAVEMVIKSRNPYIEFNPPMTQHWGISADDDEVVQCIHSADLVVCAVGLTAVERYIDGIARHVGTPVIYAYSGMGAWSGRVYRVIPGQTGCYDCHQYEILNETIPALNSPDDIKEIYDNGCALPSIPGSGIDTGIIANLASRLSIQTLLPNQAEAYQPSNIDHIVWYSQGKAGRLEMFQKAVSKHGKCTIC